MTLVIICIAAIVLTGFARHSLRLALDASRAQDDLQRRWGIASSHRVLLQRAQEIFEYHSKAPDGAEAPWPQPALLRARIQLGKVTFSVLLGDEDAKLNLNAIHENPQTHRQTTRVIRTLAPGTGSLPIQLRPYQSKRDESEPAYASWGQVYAFDQHLVISILPPLDLMLETDVLHPGIPVL